MLRPLMLYNVVVLLCYGGAKLSSSPRCHLAVGVHLLTFGVPVPVLDVRVWVVRGRRIGLVVCVVVVLSVGSCRATRVAAPVKE